MSDRFLAFTMAFLSFGIFLGGVVNDARSLGSWDRLTGFEFAVDTIGHFASACVAFASGILARRAREEGSPARRSTPRVKVGHWRKQELGQWQKRDSLSRASEGAARGEQQGQS